MKLSVHNVIRGKPASVEDLDGNKWMESVGQRVNLGYGWINIEAEWPDVFELITIDGCATSAEISGDNRKNDNFVSRQLFMVDIDSGMTIPELFDNEFYNAYGAGFYTTPSHRDEAPRFRIMFRTETPIVDSDLARLLIMGLMRQYNHADPACKDSTRIFFGTPNCTLCECRNNQLPDKIVAELVAVELDIRESQMAEREAVEYPEMTDARKQRILELLKQTYVGEWNVWRDVGWGLKAGGFSLKDFQYVTQGMMRQKTSEDARRLWADGKTQENGVTMGTVIHLLKQRHGVDCLKLTDEEAIDQLSNKIENGMKQLKERLDKWQLKHQKN